MNNPVQQRSPSTITTPRGEASPTVADERTLFAAGRGALQPGQYMAHIDNVVERSSRELPFHQTCLGLSFMAVAAIMVGGMLGAIVFFTAYKHSN